MTDTPMAYHITFGTYGTRLHGDSRGTVDRRRNRPGDPILGRDDPWRRMEAAKLRHPAIVLGYARRLHAEAEVPEICARGGWHHRQSACGPDHVHVVLSAPQDGKAVRRWLKRWLGDAMSAQWPLPPEQSWWAKGGSVKWVWDAAYLAAVVDYVAAQRATPE